MSALLPESNYPSILYVTPRIVPLYWVLIRSVRTRRAHNFILTSSYLAQGYISGITVVEESSISKKPWLRWGKGEREEIGNIKTNRVTDIQPIDNRVSEKGSFSKLYGI